VAPARTRCTVLRATRLPPLPAPPQERQLKPSPFRTWNGVDAFEFVDGVRLHAIGGEQVLLCRVTYEPGKTVPLHKHDATEQVMVIVDGSVDMAIEGERKTLRAGDVVVVNRGLEHELYSKDGVTFFEALSPVPLDHVPERDRDLVLGPDGGASHVER
jgi:quercetin dioxygenase-like cupin family protein